MFDEAKKILREFGALEVQLSGPGRERGRSGFVLDPILGADESDRFSSFEGSIGARLFPLGEATNGSLYVAVAEDGGVYLVMDHEAQLLGACFEEAVDSLLEGRLPRRRINPAQFPAAGE